MSGYFCSAILIATAFTSVILISLFPLAKRFGWLDHPKGRKAHLTPTPFTGGIAIFFGALGTSIGLLGPHSAFYSVLLGGGLLVLVGLLDDLFDLRWWIRLLSQSGAALIMIEIGHVRIMHLPGLFSAVPVELGIWSIPFTVFATVGVINAINMIDGLDGLAGTQTLAALIMMALLAFHIGNDELTFKLLILSGAIAAFLLLNLRLPWQRRARVFLGNSGSALLGYLVAWAAISLTQNAQYPIDPMIAPWLIAIPLIDCLTLIYFRLRAGRSPFSPDRNHMHHLLLGLGLNQTAVMLIMLGLSLGLSLLAVSLMLYMQIPTVLMLLLLVGFCLLYKHAADARLLLTSLQSGSSVQDH